MPEQINPLNARLAYDYASNLPWNCFKPEELGPCLVNYMKDQDIYYRRWAQKWFENYQFLFGNGDLRWSPKYDYAVDADFLLQRIPSTVQKSYTNIARVVEEALTSYVYGNQPEWECEATDDSKKTAKRISRIVQSLLDGYFEKLCLNDDYQSASSIFSLYGNVVLWNEWNPIAGQSMQVPQFQKQQVPIFSDWMQPSPFGGMIETPIAAMGINGPMTEERWMPILDQMGRQIVKTMFTGDISNSVLTPLEYRREIGSQGMHNTRYVQRIKLYDYDEWLDIFGAMSGKTKYFNDVRPIFSSGEILSFAMSHFLRMQMVTPPILNERMGKSNSMFRSSMFRYKVLVLEHFDRPHPIKWPMGRRIIVSNGVCTHVTTPQYNTNKLDGWHPAAEAQWMKIAPSSVGLGPMNDVIIKNRELNVKDSLGSTALRRNMASHLLIKQNQGVDSALFTGEPGGIFEVPDPNGFRYLHDELPLPAIYDKFRQNDKDDAYESSGAGEALRGEAPSNVTSGYQEKIRNEREEKRLIVAKRAFERAVSTNGEKLFCNLKTNVVQLDESTIGFLKRSAAGKFTIPDVIGVLTAPTDYGIDIRVKSNSMSVKSAATELATIQELAKEPAVAQRLQQDARTTDNYLKKFGIEDLRDSSAVHRDRSQRENEIFEDMLRLGPNSEGVSWPVVLFEDDDTIHLQEHDDWYLENFDEISKNPEFMKQFLLHKNFHSVQALEKTGGALPGTAQATPQAMDMVQGQPPPAPQQLIGYNQMKIAQEQKAAALPKEAGQPGAKPKDPNAPSDLTAPTSKTSGGGR